MCPCYIDATTSSDPLDIGVKPRGHTAHDNDTKKIVRLNEFKYEF